MSSARLGLERLLRPPWNFECDYDTIGGDVPILFTWPISKTRPVPGAADISVLDDEARLSPPPDGISPALAKFVPIPVGSTMLFYVPIVPCLLLQQRPYFCYVWRIVSRYRSTADWIRDHGKRRPYTIGRTSFGASDTRLNFVPDRNIAVAGHRYVMPVTTEGVIYAKPEPPGQNFGYHDSPLDKGTYGAPPFYGTLMHDAAGVPSAPWMTTSSPCYPGIAAAGAAPPGGWTPTMDYQQGVFDPSFPGVVNPSIPWSSYNPISATHLAKWIKATGNEFAVECYKFEYQESEEIPKWRPKAWSFAVNPGTHLPGPAAEDYPFSVMFGIGALSQAPPKDVPTTTGVRVIVGSAPK